MRAGRICALVAIAAAAVGCSNTVSNTGYAGAWERETMIGRSVVGLRQADDGWRVSWRLEGDDHSIRCDGEGVCDEIVSGQVIYRWILGAEERAGDPSLYVTRRGEPVIPGATPLTEVMRLELAADGLSLTSWVVSRNDADLERAAGPYEFTKLSDDPGRLAR